MFKKKIKVIYINSSQFLVYLKSIFHIDITFDLKIQTKINIFNKYKSRYTCTCSSAFISYLIIVIYSYDAQIIIFTKVIFPSMILKLLKFNNH